MDSNKFLISKQKAMITIDDIIGIASFVFGIWLIIYRVTNLYPKSPLSRLFNFKDVYAGILFIVIGLYFLFEKVSIYDFLK